MREQADSVAIARSRGSAGRAHREQTPEPPRWFERVLRHQAVKPRFEVEDGSIESDPLSAFSAERTAGDASASRRAAPVPAAVDAPAGRSRTLLAGTVVCATLVFAGTRVNLGPRGTALPPPGKLTLDTRPHGASVVIDGVARGATPLVVNLSPGAHVVSVRASTGERHFPLNIPAGADITHYVELTRAETAAATGGKISVVTDPSGARVFIDDQARGVSPLTVADLSRAQHKVAVSSASGAAERIVAVEDNATTWVVFSLPKISEPAAGWLALNAPFDVDIGEAGRVIASGRAATLMLTAGEHTVTVSNDALQYRETRNVQVTAGSTTTLRVDAPKAAFSANANPWADVIIDGANVGQTPLANVLVAIGEHDVVFQHPELGQRQRTMVVKMKDANRIAIDMTR